MRDSVYMRRVLGRSVVPATVLAVISACSCVDQTHERDEVECRRSSDCPIGRRGEEGSCVTIPCDTDFDCGSDAICYDGVCGAPLGPDLGECAAPENECQEDGDCAPYGICVDCKCLVDPGCEEPHSVEITWVSPPLETVLEAGFWRSFSAEAHFVVPAEFSDSRSDGLMTVSGYNDSGGLGQICHDFMGVAGVLGLPQGESDQTGSCDGQIPAEANKVSLYVEFAACDENFWTKVTWQAE